MPIRGTPSDWANSWSTGVSTAGNKWIAGVNGSADWAANFTAAEPQMIAGLQAAIADGRITRHVQQLTTQGWRNKTTAKGSAAYSAAATTGKTAAQAGFTVLNGYLQAAQTALAAIPRGDYATNRNRMLTQIDTVHQAALDYKASH